VTKLQLDNELENKKIII